MSERNANANSPITPCESAAPDHLHARTIFNPLRRSRWQMRAALVAAILLSGCAAPEPADPVHEKPVPEPVGASALDLFATAQAAGTAWNPAAELVLIASFEGDVASLHRAAENPWARPFLENTGPLLDGRSKVWSFTFAVDDPVHAVADAVCSTGRHAELREGLVVIVNESQAIVDSYLTRNDDEGALMTGFLPAGFIDSVAAMENASQMQRVEPYLHGARIISTFLMQGWYWDQPAWVHVIQSADSEPSAVAVHAITGDVFYVGKVPGPRC